MLSLDVIDIIIITVKDIDYCCIISNIIISNAVHLLENFKPNDSGCLLDKILDKIIMLIGIEKFDDPKIL